MVALQLFTNVVDDTPDALPDELDRIVRGEEGYCALWAIFRFVCSVPGQCFVVDDGLLARRERRSTRMSTAV